MSRTNELLDALEEAGKVHSDAVDAELKRTEKALSGLRERIVGSGVLPRVKSVIEKHDPCMAEGGGFIPLVGGVENCYAVGLKFSGEYALQRDQRKPVSVHEAAEALVQSVECRLPQNVTELDGCVERYLEAVLKRVRSMTSRREGKVSVIADRTPTRKGGS